MSKIKAAYIDSLTQTTTPVSTQKVTCSNTLSKEFEIDVCDGESFEKAFSCQELSVKEALDLAAEFAKRIYTTLDKKEHSGLVGAAVEVFNACEGWNEDELEVVMS
jgi:hypothetical protein